MIVKIVSESLDMRYNLLPSLSCKMFGEQHCLVLARHSRSNRDWLTKCHITHLPRTGVLNTRDILKLKRRVIAEKHLGSILNRPSSGIYKLLKSVRQSMNIFNIRYVSGKSI